MIPSVTDKNTAAKRSHSLLLSSPRLCLSTAFSEEKEDFLRQIRISLSGKVSPEIIEESVRYYDDYIMMQVRKGQSEEEVLASLGDPRLLAKSIGLLMLHQHMNTRME